MERDPKLKLSIELTKGEAEVLLILLDRIEPSSALATRFAEDARLFNRASGKLHVALEKELAAIDGSE